MPRIVTASRSTRMTRSRKWSGSGFDTQVEQDGIRREFAVESL